MARCFSCRQGEILFQANTPALYSSNPIGQLRGHRTEMVSVNPELPSFESVTQAVCSHCKKTFPVEKSKTGVIRLKRPKIFLALVVWHGTSPETDAQILDLFINHAHRQCECCGDESGFMIGRGRSQGSLLPFARSKAAEMALNTDCTHVLFVDQDTAEFDHEAILRMASHDLPVVSAYICRRSPPYDPVHRYMSTAENGVPAGLPQIPQVTDDELDKIQEGRVQEVFCTGMAFTLVKREVLEAIGPPFFRFLPADANNKNSGWMHGEDSSFNILAREKGFRSYVDCAITLAHMHEMPIGPMDWIKHQKTLGGGG